jgi:hypothetical protein
MNVMTTNNKKLDIFSGSALACGQVASNPRVLRRNRNGQLNFEPSSETAVFLRATERKAVGCAGNTTPCIGKHPRRTLERLETPGSYSKAAHSKNLRRFTMQTVSLADAIHDCANVVSFLSEAFSQHPAPKTLELTHSAQTGVSTILALVGDRLYRAADAIPFNHEMEV